MKYHSLFDIFEKAAKFENCRLLQMIGDALWVNLTLCVFIGIVSGCQLCLYFTVPKATES